MDLLSLAQTIMTDKNLDIVAQKNGIEKGQAADAMTTIFETLLSGLSKNASTAEGAESLDKALSKDHDGSILDTISSVLGGEAPENVSTSTLNGTKIVEHILQGKKDAATELISKKTGLDKTTVGSLLVQFAPIALGLLGKVKKDTGSDAQGISTLLKDASEKEQSNGNTFMNIATKLLDQDGDGSMVDDLLGMAGKFFFSKK